MTGYAFCETTDQQNERQAWKTANYARLFNSRDPRAAWEEYAALFPARLHRFFVEPKQARIPQYPVTATATREWRCEVCGYRTDIDPRS